KEELAQLEKVKKYPRGRIGDAFIFEGEKKLPKYYYRWQEGDVVEYGQTLAAVDYTLAWNEIKAKQARILAAEADYKAADFLAGEAKSRLERIRPLYEKRQVAAEEFSAAQLTFDKHYQDMISKQEAVNVARIELKQAKAQFEQHMIRNEIPGKSVIKMIH